MFFIKPPKIEIKLQDDNFLEQLVEAGRLEYFYYVLVDSTRFDSVENCIEALQLPCTPINLYEDLSKSLKEAGALLFALTHEEFKNSMASFKLLIEKGAFNLIASDFDPEYIQDHLEDLMEIVQPNAKSALFRFQDNFAFDATIQALEPQHLVDMLSFKIKLWFWQSPENKIYNVENLTDHPYKFRQLKLSQAEMTQIQWNLQPLRIKPRLIEYDEQQFQEAPFYEVYKIAKAKRDQAKQLGFTRFSDVTLYAILSYQFGDDLFVQEPFKIAYERTQTLEWSLQKATDFINLDELDAWYNNKNKTGAV